MAITNFSKTIRIRYFLRKFNITLAALNSIVAWFSNSFDNIFAILLSSNFNQTLCKFQCSRNLIQWYIRWIKMLKLYCFKPEDDCSFTFLCFVESFFRSNNFSMFLASCARSYLDASFTQRMLLSSSNRLCICFERSLNPVRI